MSGPTNFLPIIYEAIKIVRQEGGFHILVIIADGQVVKERETKAAIAKASKYPICTFFYRFLYFALTHQLSTYSNSSHWSRRWSMGIN